MPKVRVGVTLEQVSVSRTLAWVSLIAYATFVAVVLLLPISGRGRPRPGIWRRSRRTLCVTNLAA